MPDRDEQLQRIRDTYASYRRGRERLWSEENVGFRRIADDRDRALAQLIIKSVGGHDRGRVLDVGCGPGRLAVELQRAGLDVDFTGVDLLPEMLDQAHEAASWATWIEGSADALPFGEGAFDVVVASGLFSSLPTAELRASVAAEIGRVMADGGWLVWYDVRFPSPGNRAVHPIGRRRLTDLFHGWSIETRTMTLLPPLARRLGGTTRFMYGALERLPFLRSHLVGRLRRP